MSNPRSDVDAMMSSVEGRPSLDLFILLITTTPLQTKMKATVFLISFGLVVDFSQAFSQRSNKKPTSLDESRRKALANIASLPTVLIASPALASIATPPIPQGITTVMLDSPDSKIGVQLYDVQIGSASYSAVKSIQQNGEAALQGVEEGMIVLSGSSSKSVVQRIQSGPYPLALQFYNVAEELPGATSASEALQLAKASADSKALEKEPQLSPKGAGLGTKTTKKADKCELQARRGDTVTIAYEARVASPGGPLYDSSEERGGPVTFVLGDGQTISGVDIGMGGMCEGEIRELDIPSVLGYGRGGSKKFDLPGDVRLWWKIELLQLVEGEKRFPFR